MRDCLIAFKLFWYWPLEQPLKCRVQSWVEDPKCEAKDFNQARAFARSRDSALDRKLMEKTAEANPVSLDQVRFNSGYC